MVDDHDGFRAAASMVIDATEGFVLAGTAASGEDALAFLADHDVALVLVDLHLGGEYRYSLSNKENQSFLALRGGYSFDHDGELKLWTTGIGLKYNLVQVDVAYIFGDESPLDDNTRFSLNLAF